MRKLRLGPLYPITKTKSKHGLDHFQLAELYLSSGIGLFQVRDKVLEDSTFYEQLHRIALLCRGYDALFLVNDRVDLALVSGAGGVHLGQMDLPVAAARSLLGPDAVIGVSTHTREQFLAAQKEDVDYVALGPVFPTSTKESEYQPLGLDIVSELAAIRIHPLVAIGGINIDNVREVWKAGVDSAAVVSDVADDQNPSARIQAYMDAWARC